MSRDVEKAASSTASIDLRKSYTHTQKLGNQSFLIKKKEGEGQGQVQGGQKISRQVASGEIVNSLVSNG
jgi:hypothetical protein